MTESQRHHALLALLQSRQQVSVAEVIAAFDISPATARRDINKLNESGLLRKVRNGAEALTLSVHNWTPMNIHRTRYLDEKTRISQAAAALCRPGDSVVINCGSTAFLLGRELCGKDVQVITNYLPLANYLIEHDHQQVVIMGGQYHRQQSITLSPQRAEAELYAGQWMFTSGSGLTADGLYKADMLSAMSEQKMLSCAAKLVVLADSSKLGQRSGMLFCRPQQITTVITGQDANVDVVDALRAAGTDVSTV